MVSFMVFYDVSNYSQHTKVLLGFIIGAWARIMHCSVQGIVEEIRTDSQHFFRVHRLYFRFFANLTT